MGKIRTRYNALSTLPRTTYTDIPVSIYLSDLRRKLKVCQKSLYTVEILCYRLY